MVIILLVFIAAVITIYFTWNYLNERKKRPRSPIENDIRYHELKSKYEFLVATGSLFTIVFIFLGLNTQKDIEVKLQSEYKTLLDSALILKNDVTKQVIENKRVITLLSVKLDELRNTQKSITRESANSLSSYNSLNLKYTELNNRPILNKDFFIIQDVGLKQQDEPVIIYFKNLKTVSGKSLPNFGRPPTVLATSNNGASVTTLAVTKEYIKIQIGTWVGEETIHHVKFVIYEE